MNSKSSQSYFGFIEEELEEFENILRKAQPNPDASSFPDFIFEDGFIEHFQVTSSKVTRKGSTHRREENEFYRNVDADIEELKAEWNEKPSFNKVRSKSWVFCNPIHSYEFLVDSFKKNWENHIGSYKKYGEKQIGIFMVEYPEYALSMCENVFQDWIDGMSQGDMVSKPKIFNEYRLTRDKELLEYIYRFRDKIKYVIFVNRERHEVIRTDKVPYLLRLLPWNYVVHPLCAVTVGSMHNFTTYIDFEQEDKVDDKG